MKKRRKNNVRKVKGESSRTWIKGAKDRCEYGKVELEQERSMHSLLSSFLKFKLKLA